MQALARVWPREVFLFGVFKDIYAIWKFAQKFIEKRGNMTYADGHKIGEDIFSAVDGKKEKT